MSRTSGRISERVVVCLACAAMGASLGGCAIGQLVGGMAASAERSGSRQVKAKYTGLTDKTFAVVVAADRSLQAEQPEVVPVLTREISRRLAENAGASGMVPAEDILRFQYQRPAWVAMSPAQLAKELEVQRLVFVDLHGFATTEPGNPYVWSGSASGGVSVLEADQTVSGEFAFREGVSVRFPDSEGVTGDQMPGSTVAIELARRLVNRVSWMFYEHEEPNAIEY